MTSKVLIRCINKLNNYKVHLEEAKNDQPFEKVSDLRFMCKGWVTELRQAAIHPLEETLTCATVLQ